MENVTSYYSSPLGLLKISSTEDYIIEVSFVNDAIKATKVNNHRLLQECTQQLDEYFSGSRKVFDLPVQQAGTLFQNKIWTLLSYIPYGKQISYFDLSKQFGDVKAIRAVAAANGKNSLAIIIPCHRVIGSNRTLTGYAGGLWRKQWLLEHEAKWGNGVQQLF